MKRAQVVTREEFKRLVGVGSTSSLWGRGGRASHEPGRMNRTEAAYAEYLELRRRGGEIREWKFESYKLRLADRTWFTPDFAVTSPDGRLEFHEVKGHWEDDARVKIKVAAEMYSGHRFLAIRREGAGWWAELIGARGVKA